MMNVPVFTTRESIAPEHFGAQLAGWPEERGAVHRDLVLQVLASLALVLDRQEASYPYIDTKFHLVTGENFTDRLRGRETVFCWIQGRGLEALAGHAEWLSWEPLVGDPLRAELLDKINAILPRVVEAMEKVRSKRGNRLPFMMTPDGQPLAVNEAGEWVATETSEAATTLSDLFYAKGLMAAGSWLEDGHLMAEAERLFAEVHADVIGGRFVMGQVAFDPKNPVQNVPGRFSHAGRMIGLGAAALFYRHTKKPLYRQIGLEYIDHVLWYHTDCPGDFWEYLGVGRGPWFSPRGELWSDPGHATEFVGLALALLRETGETDPDLLARLLRVLKTNFENGFTGKGIVKAYDLKERKPINTDMPWWNLPETMRAAALGAVLMPQEEAAMAGIFGACWKAFCDGYIRRDRGLMAVQCLDEHGNVANVVPATPDADPGYHTGLSLIGALEWFRA